MLPEILQKNTFSNKNAINFTDILSLTQHATKQNMLLRSAIFLRHSLIVNKKCFSIFTLFQPLTALKQCNSAEKEFMLLSALCFHDVDFWRLESSNEKRGACANNTHLVVVD